MLSYLKIRNLAILDEVCIEPGPGLNILTGETGAGKSILVDAIALLLGARGSGDLLRTGEDRLVVEGAFDSSGFAARSALAALAAISFEPGEPLLIRRELVEGQEGLRSRAFVNDQLVTLGTVRSVGAILAEIHGQHQHQSLLDGAGQREALDAAAGGGSLREEVAASYESLRQLEAERDGLIGRERDRARLEDILRAQIHEIEEVDPGEKEEESLRREESLLRNAGEIAMLAGAAVTVLAEDDDSVIDRLGAVEEKLERLVDLDPDSERARDLVREARLAASDASRALARYLEQEQADPRRLEHVATRLAAIERLGRKYGNTVTEILAFLERAREELDQLEGTSDRLAALEAEVEIARKSYLDAATALSGLRRTEAGRLAKRIEKELAAVAMGGARVEIAVATPTDLPPGPHGIDTIEFLLATNRGEQPRSLSRVASGGELSRLMLALRNASGPTGRGATLIFDEIDSGVGGRAAETVGRRLARLAKDHQVLCVTHLPQIAAFADRHFHVEKRAMGGRTKAVVQVLDRAGRVDELARMLGGRPPSTARRHAAAMVAKGREGA